MKKNIPSLSLSAIALSAMFGLSACGGSETPKADAFIKENNLQYDMSRRAQETRFLVRCLEHKESWRGFWGSCPDSFADPIEIPKRWKLSRSYR